MDAVSVEAESATLLAGDGSKNQKGINHKEADFVFKSSSHPNSPLKSGWEQSPRTLDEQWSQVKTEELLSLCEIAVTKSDDHCLP